MQGQAQAPQPIGAVVLDNSKNAGGESGDFDMELLLHADLPPGNGENEFI